MRKILALLLALSLSVAQAQTHVVQNLSILGAVTSTTPIPVAAGGSGVATLTGLALGNGASAMSAYGGTSCTNQFPRSLSASGAATCNSVANSDLTNSSVTIGSTSVSLGATASSISGLTLVAPALGTPASGVATNLTGTAASLTAGTATNATQLGGVAASGYATSGANSNITSITGLTTGGLNLMTNVRGYGALGNSNGSHGNGNDDTSAIQAALTASAGGDLYIPCGTYRITASLTESNTSNYRIHGDGACTKIFNDSATAASTWIFNPSTVNGNVNPTILLEKIYYTAPYVTGAGQAVAKLTNESSPVIRDNIVYGYQQAFFFVTTYAPVIVNNSIYNSIGSAIDCSTDVSCNGANITANGLYSNGITGSADAINVTGGANGINITGNDIEGNYAGIVFKNVIGANVSGNYIENQTNANIFFISGNSSIAFTGNHLGASPSLSLSGITNSTFSNNQTYNYAITQGSATGVVGDNNTTLGTGGITLPAIVASGTITPSTTAGIVGTTLADSAQAGSVGEYISSSVASGSAISLTTATAANITSISLTPGDWDVRGSVFFNPASTTNSNSNIAWTSTTSATLPTPPNNGGLGVQTSAIALAQGAFNVSAGVQRINVSTTTTVYLSGYSSFTTSTMGAYGFIAARRVR